MKLFKKLAAAVLVAALALMMVAAAAPRQALPSRSRMLSRILLLFCRQAGHGQQGTGCLGSKAADRDR